MKKNDIRKEWVEDYIAAVSNEIEIDTHSYKLYGLRPNEGGYLPRPMKWVARFNRMLPIIRGGAFGMRLVWFLGGGGIFFLKELTTFYRYMKKHLLSKERVMSSNVYGLAFSSRATSLIKYSNIGRTPNIWITFPWVNESTSIATSKRLDIFALLSTRELWKAFSLSMVALYTIMTHRELRPWALQTYTAFRWFLVRLGIEKLCGEFYIAEHYDRWAVLADSIVYRKNLMVSESNLRCKLHLVQHGSVMALDQEQKMPGLAFTLKYKLKAVSDLYVYGDVSEAVFRRDILCKSDFLAVDAHYYSPKIELSKALHSDPAILFVGHPICETIHIEIYRTLRHKYPDMAFYYKPHPTALPSESVRQHEWTIINDAQYFPVVSFIISYPSTLVTEYRSHNIPAVVHAIDAREDQVNLLLQEIEKVLASGR